MKSAHEINPFELDLHIFEVLDHHIDDDNFEQLRWVHSRISLDKSDITKIRRVLKTPLAEGVLQDLPDEGLSRLCELQPRESGVSPISLSACALVAILASFRKGIFENYGTSLPLCAFTENMLRTPNFMLQKGYEFARSGISIKRLEARAWFALSAMILDPRRDRKLGEQAALILESAVIAYGGNIREAGGFLRVVPNVYAEDRWRQMFEKRLKPYSHLDPGFSRVARLVENNEEK